MTDTINRRYGWKRGLPSRRFPELSLTVFPPLSPSKSLVPTGFLPPIWDQGDTSSCTGHGTTRGIMFQRAKQGLPFVDLSRLFPYWNARVAEGDTSDNGAVIGDVVAASQKFGDCPYSDLPTNVALTTKAPTPQAFTNALVHKALAATRVMGNGAASLEYHIKHCIDILGLPVVVGVSVYESFESDAVAASGNVPMPGPNETMLGGHCVVVVGYDDPSRLFTLHNSWGISWAKQGAFTLPYAYLLNPGLSDDFHAITLESAA